MGAKGAWVLGFWFTGFTGSLGFLGGSGGSLVRHTPCVVIRMAGVRSFMDLDAWKLANALKLGVYELLQRACVQRDREFHSQIRNAAASAPRNIAEGFGRFQPRDFSQYLRIANGSLQETSNHLRDGVDRGYFRPEEIVPLETLVRRASAATTALLRYLRHAREPRTRTNEPPTNP